MFTPLPDPRPYPTDPIKNELLLYASQIAQATSGAQSKLARENLHARITEMLAQKHVLSLSVAMSMAASADIYAVLMDSVADVLNAKNDDEVQWFALPVIIVAGSKQAAELNTFSPCAELAACLANYPAQRPLTHAQWLPQLLRADDFAQIKAENWFAAKQSFEAAEAFAAKLPTRPLHIPQDQSVHAAYALGYGKHNIQAALGVNLREAALPLMQIWQQHLAQKGLTLFTNPLNPNNPIHALADAGQMRLRMALDVFATNAIRAVRLQSPRVGVVIAAQESSKLLFGFNATENAYGLQNQVFTWTLSPRDNIAMIVQNFLDLMSDCQVEHIRLLHEMLPEHTELPTYAEAQNHSGHNPLLHNSVQ
ncbi:MAG: conjugal transfer protein [Alysiella sp.]|uniref:conjugal transfer protein n=1 Tax=Alysiella sp. TaxID=1872483 RepID=UPI0026DD30F3|nr:conjugal transfer protein [Alysiella sp.]MDO4433576.1 conjugal transfer protein [Alysiella sp.]